jgi:hypothetical protein
MNLAGPQWKTPGSLLKRGSMIVAMTFFLAPQAVFAEKNDSLPFAGKSKPTSQMAEKAAVKRVSLGLDDDGNVMIHYGGTSLTLIYGPDGTGNVLKQRVGLVPPLKETVGIGEVSFKVGFTF